MLGSRPYDKEGDVQELHPSDEGEGEKEEMIEAANKMGYVGQEDNEADAFLLAQWYIKTNL